MPGLDEDGKDERSGSGKVGGGQGAPPILSINDSDSRWVFSFVMASFGVTICRFRPHLVMPDGVLLQDEGPYGLGQFLSL